MRPLALGSETAALTTGGGGGSPARSPRKPTAGASSASPPARPGKSLNEQARREVTHRAVLRADIELAGARRLSAEEQRALELELSQVYGQLFEKYDADGSSTLEFRELRDVVRGELKLAHREFSEDDVRRLWLAVDADDDGRVCPRRRGAARSRKRTTRRRRRSPNRRASPA